MLAVIFLIFNILRYVGVYERIYKHLEVYEGSHNGSTSGHNNVHVPSDSAPMVCIWLPGGWPFPACPNPDTLSIEPDKCEKHHFFLPGGLPPPGPPAREDGWAARPFPRPVWGRIRWHMYIWLQLGCFESSPLTVVRHHGELFQNGRTGSHRSVRDSGRPLQFSVFVLNCLTQQFSFRSGSLDELCVYTGNVLQCSAACPTNRS